MAEIYPELVIPDAEGHPYTIRYDQLTPMLLNEVLRLRRELEALARRQQEVEGRRR